MKAVLGHQGQCGDTVGQGEWRLRNLQEAMRDSQVYAEGLNRSLRCNSTCLKAAQEKLTDHVIRYGDLSARPPSAVRARPRAARKRLPDSRCTLVT